MDVRQKLCEAGIIFSLLLILKGQEILSSPDRKAVPYLKYITVREYEKNLILEDLARTKQALDNAYDHFENVVDPDLIDCYIYEVNAVQQKYKYLLKMAKQLQITPKIPEF